MTCIIVRTGPMDTMRPAVPAFEEWYRALRPRVHGVVLGLAHDGDLAADITADAFERAYARWTVLADADHRDAWVFTVALNAFRRHARRRTLDGRVRARTARAEVGAWAEPDPDLWRAVGRLAPRQRHAVVLRYVGDLTERQVAEVLEISEGGASALLAKARRELQRALEGSHGR
jgi:RNA polymerase sigma factor (sigma-70 family)